MLNNCLCKIYSSTSKRMNHMYTRAKTFLSDQRTIHPGLASIQRGRDERILPLVPERAGFAPPALVYSHMAWPLRRDQTWAR